MLLGVDVGGTFTDAVLAFDGRIVTAKAPTTPHDQSEGVIAAVEAALERAGRPAEEIEEFSHGMTVATNALLEGRAARTALIATEGFTDLVELGRQNRPELYRLCAARPAPLVPPELRFGGARADDPSGPARPLAPGEPGRLASQAREAGVESIAVVLLHSYRHPEHELEIGRALEAELPDVHVSLSHEVVGTFREFERAATTEIDAALSPLLARLPEPDARAGPGRGIARAVDHAVERRPDRRVGRPRATPRGRCCPVPPAAPPGPRSWPGPRGSRARSASTWAEPLATCASSTTGRSTSTAPGEIAGRPIALPMLAVHTVGAGGGSIAWRDPGGALRVGPRSAGADPGPACYGRGGTEPTVTDANLLLGYLGADAPLAGGVELDAGAAEAAIEALAGELELDALACAEGIVRVANAEMVRALRVVTVERGIDPRDYALLAFGGAGPLHAAEIADELGIDSILCPRASGVLAALGLVVSPRRRDAQRTVLLSGAALTAEAIATAVDELGERARRELGAGAEAELRATYELRYRGQSFELPVAGRRQPHSGRAAQGFRGRARAPLRLQRSRPGARARHNPRQRKQPRGRGRARGGRRAAGAAARPPRGHDLGGAARARGGARVAGARHPDRGAGGSRAARVHAARTAGLARGGRPHRHDRDATRAMIDPVELQVLTGALRAVCEEMGAVLIRSAHSANIKERRDASTALFDAPRADGDAGRAHPGPPRGDAGGGRGGARLRAGARTLLDPQRPVPGRDASARHHGDHAGVRRRGGGQGPAEVAAG